MTEQNGEQLTTSRHAVTEPWRCIEMETKYGWTLVNIEPNRTKDLPYDCEYERERSRRFMGKLNSF